MRIENMDFAPHTDTLVAVVLGALLATLSGVVANQVEARTRRQDRQRAAALLFGEVLSTLRVLLQMTVPTRKIGDPYGPVTERMLRAARREIDIYERNREALLDLSDPALRVEMHNVMIRIAMPLDGILDSFLVPPPTNVARDQGFDFMMTMVEKLPDLVGRLGKLAHHSFEQYIDRATTAPAPAPDAAP